MKLCFVIFSLSLLLLPLRLHAFEHINDAVKLKNNNSAIAQLEQSMVAIPAGSFYMGSTLEADEMPVHKVTIAAFKMMATEVTNAMWQACTDCISCRELEPFENCFCSLGPQSPISNVSYKDIVESFIPWLNKKTGKTYRLPTEAEWEYAARSESNTAYSWGEKVGVNNAACNGCGSMWDDIHPAPVKQFKANKFGLYDMHGNVDEWVEDCYAANYNNADSNGAAQIENCHYERVLRGGTWASEPKHLRSSKRYFDSENFRFNSNGFRLVLSE